MAALRYLLLAVVGIVLASVMFIVLNLVVTTNAFSGATAYVEGWILRATCEQYELAGTVRDARGAPVPFAVIEVAYLDERLTTRSNLDGTYVVKAAEAVCNRRPPANATVLVVAEEYRPKRQAVPFATATLDVALEPQDFRP